MTQEDPEKSRLGLWLAFAGTILAALIGGAFTLIATAMGDHHDPAPTPASAAAGPAPVATTAAAPVPTTATAVAPPGPGERFRGTVRMAFGFPMPTVDFDAVPPVVAHDNDAVDVGVDMISPDRKVSLQTYLGNSRLGLTTLDGPVSRDACKTAMSGASSQLDGFATGTVVCLRTSAGRLAALTLRSVDGTKTAVFDVVVREATA